MIQFIPFQKIEKSRWDHCVINSPQKSIFGLYDSICTACEDWIGIVLNDYQAVLALPIKKKLGLSYSWHPQFMGPLGVYSDHFNESMMLEILDALPSKTWWIKMHYWQKCQHKDFQMTEMNFQELSLNLKTIEEIRSGYNENIRRNLKKAAKQQLTIKQTNDINLLLTTFHREEGNQIDNINHQSYTLLRKLMEHWINLGFGTISEVYHGDNLAAIGYFIHWNGINIYYKGAVTEEGKNCGAMHLLIDQEIEMNLENFQKFDFGGSNIESVSRFYKGFGGVDRSYYLFEYKKFKI